MSVYAHDRKEKFSKQVLKYLGREYDEEFAIEAAFVLRSIGT